MTPSQVYREILTFSGKKASTICNLHSACRPDKGMRYLCGTPMSKLSVVNFDDIKSALDKVLHIDARSSVDAITESPSGSCLCFIELKSWELLLHYKGTKKNVECQAKKYESDLPKKLSESIEICKQLCGNDALDDCSVVFVLVTDISIAQDGIADIESNLSALAGTSSDLRTLCNKLSKNIMDGIRNVETRYWYCREFDSKMSEL